MTQSFGAAPVGHLDAMPEDQAFWIRSLRLWCAGDGERDSLAAGFADRLGARRADLALARFDDLMTLTLQHSRRPLLRHARDCRCAGADEAAFALFCSVAGAGEREDAMLIGCLLMRADVVPMALSLAQSVSLDLRRPAAMPAGALYH
ncbi:hypothetical protein [Histidinibacterium aquaticum]|uniref:Uncharacterized protein n=1 Tax=Histidinibacterium aquaticum TaxID=2613962 RepID=A0A5J5GEB0_9RHOB|nr:hypothetical protein [Histidinibacterium aquaticum]KAA9006093.1 hypothetical protein F3S47_16200 [Histidinibacterium aquaticum]